MESRWPNPLMAVLAQQILEPQEEQKLRAIIPRLTGIEDEVSVQVQKQYEENPYPRWVRATPASEAKDIVGYLAQKFPFSSFKRQGTSGNADVLVAGCGTRQHSIEVAQKLQRTKLLAVDLSMNSLAYAKRKTQELGLTSIDYAQADLLKLGSLGHLFHAIEAIGVLHHLADPLVGWRVLLSLLHPGGFMKLGFYSEVARCSIARTRAVIDEQGYTATTANEIRECRQYLTGTDKRADFETITKSLDFFTTSACRDLLFHTKEHCLTLSCIEEFCQEHTLTFLGFEIDPAVLHAYRDRFPDAGAAAVDNAAPKISARILSSWFLADCAGIALGYVLRAQLLKGTYHELRCWPRSRRSLVDAGNRCRSTLAVLLSPVSRASKQEISRTWA